MSHPFVDFLVERSLISQGVAEKLSRGNRFIREPIGMIAVNHGLLNADQIDHILDRQRSTQQRFGEVAIEFGYLTPEQVDTLVKIQVFRASADIAEALALSGVFSCEDAARYLGAYLVNDHELADMLAGK